ncbi:MAG: Hpt domain-containing protein, partial [Chloroflexota bacterium]
MSDHPLEEAPRSATTRRGIPSGLLNREKAAPVSKRDAAVPPRTLGQATNLKRVRLSAPEPTPPPVPPPFLSSPDPATVEKLPEPDEAFPSWPSEEEMLAAWDLPATDQPRPESSWDRTWATEPAIPLIHQTEVLEPAVPPSSGDLRSAAIDSVSFLGSASPPTYTGFLPPIAPLDSVNDGVLSHLDLAFYPPTPAMEGDEPAEYFPTGREGDTTLRLTPAPREENREGTHARSLDPPMLTVAAIPEKSIPAGDSPGGPASPRSAAPESSGSMAVSAPPEVHRPAAEPSGAGHAGLAAQLLEVFKEEAVEMLDLLHASLETLERGPSESALIEARRTVHTMKGSARMCG